MSFSFVKTSVKIAVLNALNISSSAQIPSLTIPKAQKQDSLVSDEVAYAVNTSSAL